MNLSVTMWKAIGAATRDNGMLSYVGGGWGARNDLPDPDFTLNTVKALERRGLVEFIDAHKASLTAHGWRLVHRAIKPTPDGGGKA